MQISKIPGHQRASCISRHSICCFQIFRCYGMNGIMGTLLPSLSFGVFGMNQMIFAGQLQRVRLPLAVEYR